MRGLPFRSGRADPVNLTVYFHIFSTILGLGVVAPALPEIRDEFGVSYAEVSLVFSVFAVARLFVDLPAGYLTTRVPGLALLCLSAALVGTGTLASGLAPNFEFLLGTRLVVGAGSALASTVGMTVLAQRAPAARMGKTMGMYHTALIAGALISPGLGGLIAAQAGWRVAFFVCAAAALTSVFVTFFAFRRWPTNPQERVPGQAASRHAAQPPARLVLMLWPAFLATFGLFFMRNAGTTLFPLYGKDEVALGTAAIGGVLTMNAIVSATLTTPAGMAADRWGSTVLLVPGFIAQAAGAICLLFASTFTGFVLASLVFSLGAMVNSVPSSMIAASTGPASRGLVLGAYRFVGDLGFTAGPLTMGFLLNQYGFGAASITASALLMSILAVIVLFGRGHNLRRAQTSPAPATVRQREGRVGP